MQFGKKIWMIPDMYWPEITTQGTYVSHESICILNPMSDDCTIRIKLYYEDRVPVSLPVVTCGGERTVHIRMDRIKTESMSPLPKGVPYAAVVECSQPVAVQYTRVDTTQSANSLMTTMAYPLD